MEVDNYSDVLKAATFLASKGDVALALNLVKTSLEKLFLEKEGLKSRDIENEEKLNEIEVLLTQKYIAFRSKLEGERRPYWRTFINTFIIGIIAAVSIMITSTFIFYLTKSVIINRLMDSITAEIHGMASEVKAEIPGIADKIKAEIPGISEKIVDKISGNAEN